MDISRTVYHEINNDASLLISLYAEYTNCIIIEFVCN